MAADIGGKVEEGEDLLQATEREFEEETGLKIKAVGILANIFYDYGGEVGRVEVSFIECRPFSNSHQPMIGPQAYEKVGWVKVNDLLTLDFIETDRLFVNMLKYDRERERRGLPKR